MVFNIYQINLKAVYDIKEVTNVSVEIGHEVQISDIGISRI